MTSKSSVSRKISLLLFAFLVFQTGAAWAAKKRVVVTRFAGRGEYAQKAATDVVARDAVVLNDAAWTRAMKKLKLRSTASPEAVVKVAGALSADGVVSGSVQRSGKAWSVIITVTDGKTGLVNDTLEIPLKNYHVDAANRKAIAEKLAPAIAKLGGGDAPLEIAPEATAPAPVARPEVDTEAAPIGRVEAPPLVDTRRSSGPESTVEASASSDDGRYSRSRAFDIAVGGGISVRSLDFNAVGTLPAAQAPRGYSGSAVPTLIVDAELYPLAFGGNDSAISGLGVGVVLERVLSISSKLADTEYDTTQTRIGGELIYRLNFGQTASGPTLKILAGIEHLDFNVDRKGADLGFPNVSYTYFDVGLGGRIPLGSPKFALYLDVRYLHVLSAGEINNSDFYGSGSGMGFALEGGFEYIFAKRATLRLGGRYDRLSLDFDGNGTLSNNRDGNPATKDVEGASDAFAGGYLTIGYLF